MVSDANGKIDAARKMFEQHNGILKTMEAINLGIHRRTLYGMRDSGILEQLDRGLFRLTELPPLAYPDLVQVALKIPRGVICLISALSFHEITTQIPHEIHVAIEQGKAEPSRLRYPPLRQWWFSGDAFHQGIRTVRLDGVDVRIYSPEKTLADCFKFRKKIGLDVAIEAVKQYREQMRMDVDSIMNYARICRVANVMKPYLEAIF